MKKLYFLIIFILTVNFIQAQVNGFTLTDSSYPTAHNLGTAFPLNVSFNWTPSTTSASVEINYDPALVSYDASCSAVLPACMNITDDVANHKLTVAMSDLSACTDEGAISFNVCFQFKCPSSCIGVSIPTSFTGKLTDNFLT